MELLTMVIIGVAVVLILAILVMMYNGLVILQKRVDNAWAQIDVQLKRRADLIPNLIETVKGYAKFEKSVLTDVTKARTAMMSAKTPAKAARAEDMMTNALKSVFAVAEAYPKLQASENFKALQEELAATENKIAFSRQFYNDSAMEWNTKISVIPTNIVAALAGMKQEREYFQVAEPDRKSIKVDMSGL